MEKKKMRIGELAKHLDVQQFVIRFWEKEFNLGPKRSDGGQRFYSQKDLDKFTAIKELLYEKGFTIAGAKKHFEDLKNSSVVAASKLEEPKQTASKLAPDLNEKIIDLHQKLIKLRSLLQ